MDSVTLTNPDDNDNPIEIQYYDKDSEYYYDTNSNEYAELLSDMTYNMVKRNKDIATQLLATGDAYLIDYNRYLTHPFHLSLVGYDMIWYVY